MKLINGQTIRIKIKQKWVEQSILTYLSCLKYSMNYKLVSYFFKIVPVTVKKRMLEGTCLMYTFFTQKIISPQWLTKDKLKKQIPNDLPLLYGSNIRKHVCVLVDGTDITISRPSDFDLSSLTRSGKSNKWSVRVLCYGCLNGMPITTLPLRGCVVTGRHNDANLFDFFRIRNHDGINDLLDPRMFIYTYFNHSKHVQTCSCFEYLFNICLCFQYR